MHKMVEGIKTGWMEPLTDTTSGCLRPEFMSLEICIDIIQN